MILPLLLADAEAKEDGTRAMGAECLGSLARLSVSETLPCLISLAKSQSVLAKQTAIIAFRFSFAPDIDWALISEHLAIFAALLKDASLIIRQQAVLTFESLFKCNIGAISRELMDTTIVPALYAEAVPHPELIRMVDYGGWKEKVDDGLFLRKSLFMCLSSLLDRGSERLNIKTFLEVLMNGVTDHVEIQVVSLKMLESVARRHPGSLLEVLDLLPDKIMDTVKCHIKAAKPDPTASKQAEIEQAMDCLRALVKALCVFNAVPGHEMCVKYATFFKQIRATASLKALLDQCAPVS